jgi:DNA-binding protein HU-beta
VNKTELVERLAKKAGLTKKGAGEALSGILDVITESLCKGEAVTVTGFGKFEVRTRKASVRRNPQTQRKMNVPAKVVPVFRAGKHLKALVLKRVRAR